MFDYFFKFFFLSTKSGLCKVSKKNFFFRLNFFKTVLSIFFLDNSKASEIVFPTT